MQQSGSRYTTVQVWPTGTGKRDCTRAVYHESTTVKVDVIVIVVVTVDGKPAIHTESTKTDKPTSVPAPVTYEPSATETGAGSSGTATAPGSEGTGAVHNVELRADNGTFHYVPDHVEAKLGDTVHFIFRPKAHSVTQSEFKTPCTFNGGFDSGLLPGSLGNNVTRDFKVTDVSKPLWFYCKAAAGTPAGHCGLGMVFGINPGNKMDQFIANAKAQKVSGSNDTASATATIASSTASSTSTATGAVTTVVVSGGFNASANINTLKYEPSFIKRAVAGDVILFDFRKANHTVTESNFDNPCKKKDANAFDTMFNNVNAKDTPLFSTAEFTVPDDKPHYFYCRQNNGLPNGHCSNGMVFAINIEESRFDAFKANAEKTLPVA
ncbi:hypothetical protein BDV95DRAFT_8042 [Massariosphaeria phaeospora]|uniref:Cupredoxin n=1 Tax=Massariosphaeria phaeospora TaxID=100035 RepID=A0A7C8IIG8_9PLEO|nr:hypothetical protein BDV95DRAFT_8042 [Massariosphaeria phaeospora]